MRKSRGFASKLSMAAVIAVVAAALASGQTIRREREWNTKTWPDISLKLENPGKQSEAARAFAEHESAARLFFQQKRYEDAAREYQKCIELDSNAFHPYLGAGYSFYH